MDQIDDRGIHLIHDMTNGRPLKLILRLVLPMLAGTVFQQLYNVVDMLIVGKAVGSRALAAVGATGAATFFALAMVTGLTNGFTAVTAQYFGAKDLHNIRKTFVSTIYISIVCIVLLAAVGIFGAEPLLRLLNTPDDIIHDSTLYLQICIGGSVGLIIYNGISATLRALGDSRTPLIFLILTSLLNVLLDLLFVLVFDMAVVGVAIATVTAQCVSAAACLVYLLKRYDILRPVKGDFRPYFPTIGLILKIGLPIGLQTLLLSVGDMTITGMVNLFGTDVVAANATGHRILEFSMMFCMNLAMAFAVFAGQNLGAQRIDRIKSGFKETLWMVTALCIVMTVLVFAFGDTLVRFFISDTDTHIDAVVSFARINLRITASFYLFLGLIWLYNYALNGMGDVLIPFISGMTELVLKVGLSIMLGNIFGYTGIWFAMPAGWVLGLIPSIIRFHTGGWARKAKRFQPQSEGTPT